jgi:(4S)-4-hydroxy-5-phosphonooxypentane-2,3-dione isomerase
MSTIALLVELTLRAGQKDAYIARAGRHRAAVLDNEPGCRRFDIMVPDDGADTVMLYELYDNAAALEAHMQTPYMKAYLDETAPMIIERRRRQCICISE